MVNRPFRMNLQCSKVAPCIRRVIHKRLDSDDQPPAKCARLSPDSGDPQGLLGTSPSSPVSPTVNPIPTTHQGPSRIGAFLLLPLADRESLHGAMNTDTGDELLCKVCAIQGIVQFSLNEWCCSIACLTFYPYLAHFFQQMSFSREVCWHFA